MRTLLAFGAALLVSTSAQASINLVVNGSFETGVAPNGVAFLATNNTTSIAGWKVLSKGINYVDNSVWDASDGNRSVSLSTTAGAGGIMQRVSGFNVGSRYRVTFDISTNPFDLAAHPAPSRVTFTTSGGNSSLFSYTLTPSNNPNNMNYSTVSYEFFAVSTSQNVQFRSLVNSKFGPVIDNVSISAVPEASTWAMLITGFGMVGFASRRRKLAAVAA